MTNDRTLHVIVLRLSAVLLILVMLSTSMVADCYARYVATATYEDSTRVARFNIIEESSLYTDVATNVQPGTTALEGITVKNYSAVTVDFTITVTSQYDNLPLSFEMKEGENTLAKTESSNGVTTFTGTIGPNQQKKEFKLYISWPIEENGLQYSGKVDVVRVGVTAVQTD